METPRSTATASSGRLRGLLRRRPLLGLTAIVVGSATLAGLGSLALPQPIVFRDELVYSEAAKALASGHVPAGYGYGWGYPALIAPLYRVFTHVPDAYVAIKLVDAIVFSLAAIPAYLIARRCVRPSLALAVALLTVLLPARTYSYLVTTESLAFLLFLLFVLALLRMLESPTLRSQLVVMFVGALAFETRRQLIVLAAAVPLTILGTSLLEARDVREALRSALRRYSAVWLAILAAVAIGIAKSITGGSGGVLGPYAALAHGYELGPILTWLRNDIAVLGLVLGVVPLIALPLGLARCLRRVAATERRALAVTTVVLVALVVAQVTVFSSTSFGLGRVHERYLFYVAPLVFAVFAVWLDDGMRRPRFVAAGLATAVALLPLLLPTKGHVSAGIDAPTLHALGFDTLTRRPQFGSSFALQVDAFHLKAVIVSAVLALWFVISRPKRRWLLVAAIGLAFVVVDLATHQGIVDFGRGLEQLAAGDRSAQLDWVDRRVGRDERVAILFVPPRHTCPAATREYRHALATLWRVEFFNASSARVVVVGVSPDTALPFARAVVGPTGRVTTATGLEPRFVVADRRVTLAGKRLAVDQATRWALWRIAAPLRVLGARGTGDLRAMVCDRRA